MELNQARDIKDNKKSFHKYVSNTRLGQVWAPILKEIEDLLTQDKGKTEGVKAFLSKAFTCKNTPQESQLPETREKGWSKEDVF